MDLSQESFARLKFDNKSLKTAKKRLLLRVGNVILGVEAGHYTRWRKTPDTPKLHCCDSQSVDMRQQMQSFDTF